MGKAARLIFESMDKSKPKSNGPPDKFANKSETAMFYVSSGYAEDVEGSEDVPQMQGGSPPKSDLADSDEACVSDDLDFM